MASHQHWKSTASTIVGPVLRFSYSTWETRQRSFSWSFVKRTDIRGTQEFMNFHRRQIFLTFSPTPRATGLGQLELQLATAAELMRRLLPIARDSEDSEAESWPGGWQKRELCRRLCGHFLKSRKVQCAGRFDSTGRLWWICYSLCHGDQISDRNNILEWGIILAPGSWDTVHHRKEDTPIGQLGVWWSDHVTHFFKVWWIREQGA